MVGTPYQPFIVRGIYFRWFLFECSLLICPSHIEPKVCGGDGNRCHLAASCLRLPDIEPYLTHGSVALTSLTVCSELSSSTYYYLDVCRLYSLRVAHNLFEEPLLPLLSRHRLR